MKANPLFLKQPKHFWANVRSISQRLGYTNKKKQIKVHDLEAITRALVGLGLDTTHVVDSDGDATATGQVLVDYFAYRADVLNGFVEPRLMDAERAAATYESVRQSTKSKIQVVMNKQKGEKKKPAYLTNIVNWLVDANSSDLTFDVNPRKLTTFTQGGAPLRTLARRVDGAFPSTVNPVAVWENKEYYFTTTSGSRVADGVYETLLDGMELEELFQAERMECKHYLFVDAHFTWWVKGKPYLCRIVDMLHMGYVDEVLFGIETIDRVPALAKEWVMLVKTRQAQTK